MRAHREWLGSEHVMEVLKVCQTLDAASTGKISFWHSNPTDDGTPAIMLVFNSACSETHESVGGSNKANVMRIYSGYHHFERYKVSQEAWIGIANETIASLMEAA